MLKRHIAGLSNSIEWDLGMSMDRHVVLGDRLGVVIPSLFSAFQESAGTGTLELALHHVASFVLKLDALGAVIHVSEEGNHVDLLFLSGLL